MLAMMYHRVAGSSYLNAGGVGLARTPQRAAIDVCRLER